MVRELFQITKYARTREASVFWPKKVRSTERGQSFMAKKRALELTGGTNFLAQDSALERER